MSAGIRDVANLAGVSASTVSRVFAKPDTVRAATRDSVLAVAERLGYRPSRMAQALRNGRSGNIGIIVPDLSNPFFPPILDGAQKRARAGDYALFIATSEEDPALEEELVRAMSKQVDGLVLCSPRLSDAQIRDLSSYTMLALVQSRPVEGILSVQVDNFGGMAQATDHVVALGHRRIAYLGGPKASWADRERRRAIRRCAQRDGLDIVWLGPFPPTYEAGKQAADLASAAGVTAVLAYNDLLALGAIAQLAARGVAIPQEMSVVGFDDIQMAAMATPPLTTVAMPKEAAGRAAIDQLLADLHGSAGRGSPCTALETRLIVRSSTEPQPTAS